MIDAVRLSLSWMTVLPVGRAEIPDDRAAGRAMTALPVVGLVCGVLATAAAHGMSELGAGPLLAGVAGVGIVVALTRGMHVDALADTADALGSYSAPERAREIMHSGSVGPMGAAVLVLVLLAEVAALGALAETGSWLAPIAAFTLARSLPVLQLRRGVPAATTTGFGALVAESQGRLAVLSTVLIAVVAGAGLAGSAWDPDRWWVPVLGVVAGLLACAAAAAFARHAVRRFGGINGDVLGASIEAGTATALVMAVILL